jgi:hypothetical protein
MKLTSLVVITLLVLSCGSAFAASGTFSAGFLSYTGGLQYCDFEVLSFNDPFIGGIHNLTTGCGLLVDGAMAGLKGLTLYPGTTPVEGVVYNLADNTIDAEFQQFTGCQIDWVTKRVFMTNTLPKFGWEFFFTCGGGADYLGNFGFLTTHLGPVAQQAGTPTSSFHGTQTNAKKVF